MTYITITNYMSKDMSLQVVANLISCPAYFLVSVTVTFFAAFLTNSFAAFKISSDCLHSSPFSNLLLSCAVVINFLNVLDPDPNTVDNTLTQK